MTVVTAVTAGSGLLRWAGPTTLLAAMLLSIAGLWLRALNAPVWPTVLTDWSLGSALLSLSAAAVGTVVASRFPRNVVGWLFCTIGMLTGLVFCAREYATYGLLTMPGTPGAGWMVWLFATAIPLNMTCLALLVLLFPHGSPPSHRWRPVAFVVVAGGSLLAGLTALSPYVEGQLPSLFVTSASNPLAVLPAGPARWLIDLGAITLMVGLATGVIGLVHRLRRTTQEERQQVKWFVFAAVVATTTYAVGAVSPPVFVVATLVALPAVPAAAGLAVLRYRLYDIDRIVSRTVAYGLVSGLLVAVYAGAVVALNALLPLDDDSPLTVAAATLAAAAAFNPLRRRVQAGVDRRFNRARYDAARAVESFGARLRDATDPDALAADLLAAVGHTVQPVRATLWLRSGGRR